MKKNIFVVSLLVSINCLASQHSPTFDGKYDCAGSEVGTKESFTCELTIKQTGETYASRATCSDGNSYTGTGIYNKKSGQLSTAFINPKKSEETGICVADIKPDGVMLSTWTYLHNTSVTHTTCIKQKS